MFTKQACVLLVIVSIVVVLLVFTFSSKEVKNHSTTLVLVHVLFRHGERHPDIESLCPTSQYYDEKNYPEGYGQLTNIGKQKEYSIGTYLRARYDNFLGPTWNVRDLEPRSTDYNRTKMSLQLVLAGLYPPQGFQRWSTRTDWQPIPYNYLPRPKDKELLPFYFCPRYLRLMEELYDRPEIRNHLQRYGDAIKTLEKHCTGGKNSVDLETAFYLHNGFQILKNAGHTLEEWTKTVYPVPLDHLALDKVKLMANTTETKRIASGYLLKKILADTISKINRTLSSRQKKMFLYGGHEMNIAPMLGTLNVHNNHLHRLPTYGSYMLFEVHKINGTYGFKIFYQNYELPDPVLLKMQGCDYFCPYDTFYKLVEPYVPENDEECYGASN